eukprot:6212811-Pleurochrysis_carterae.AAC.2
MATGYTRYLHMQIVLARQVFPAERQTADKCTRLTGLATDVATPLFKILTIIECCRQGRLTSLLAGLIRPAAHGQGGDSLLLTKFSLDIDKHLHSVMIAKPSNLAGGEHSYLPTTALGTKLATSCSRACMRDGGAIAHHWAFGQATCSRVAPSAWRGIPGRGELVQ